MQQTDKCVTCYGTQREIRSIFLSIFFFRNKEKHFRIYSCYTIVVTHITYIGNLSRRVARPRFYLNKTKCASESFSYQYSIRRGETRRILL